MLVIYYVLGYYLLGNMLVAILNLTFRASVEPRKKETFLNAISCNQNSKHLKHISTAFMYQRQGHYYQYSYGILTRGRG